MGIEPLDFLQSISGFLQANQPGSTTKNIRLATIDPAYVSTSYPGTLPKVTFDGEETMSAKTYAVVSNYRPTASDRVVLLPIGATYVIIGALDRDASEYFGGGQLDFAHSGIATVLTTRTTVGSTNPRFFIQSNGSHNWGDGTASTDTNLGRTAANVLRTDDSFEVGEDLTVGDDVTLASGSVVTWAGDTNLYRTSADILKTDDALVVGGALIVGSQTAVTEPGHISDAVITTSSANITAETVVLTIPSQTWVNGRAYRIRVRGGVFGSVAGNLAYFRMRKTNAAGALWGDFYRVRTEAGNVMNLDIEMILTNTTGSNVTAAAVLTMSLSGGSGTVTVYAAAGQPTRITVYDAGSATLYANAFPIT